MLKDKRETSMALPPDVKAAFDKAKREVERVEERNVTIHEFLMMLLTAWATREGGKE